MAVNIGPRIGIDGEADYRKALQNIIQETKTLDAEMKSLSSSFDANTSTQEKNEKQAEILRKKQATLTKEVEEMKKAVDASTDKYGEGATTTLKWKEALAKAETELSQVNSQLKDVTGWGAFAKNIEESSAKLKSLGESMTSIGKKMTASLTVPIVGLGTVSVKTAADFESSMTKVGVISGATADELDILTAKAQEMGASTMFSASESADALGYMALAGWNTTEMVEGLDGVLNLAAASGMELANASDMVTDYLTAFGLSASDAVKMADELVYAQNTSNTTAEQLGEAFSRSAANMTASGQSMETTIAILEAFANQGTKGSVAGTSLAAVMRDITNHMEDGAIAIGDVNIAVQDQEGNYRSLIDIMGDIEKATDGMGSAEKAAALSAVFTSDSIRGVNQIMSAGAENVQGYADALNEVSGVSSNVAETMEGTLNGQMTQLKSQLEAIAIQVGEILIPAVSSVVAEISQWVQKFSELDEGTRQTIINIAGIVAVAGPLITGIGSLVTALGSIGIAISKVQPFLTTLGTFFSGLIPHITSALGAVGQFIAGLNPVVVAIGLVVAAIAVWMKNWEDIKALAIIVKDAIVQVMESIKEKVVSIVMNIVDTVKNWMNNLKNTVVTVFTTIKSTIVEKWNSIFTSVSNILIRIKNAFTSTWNGIKSTVMSVISKVVDKVRGMVQAIQNAMNFNWELPHLKMPHIGISGHFSLNPPSAPSFHIDWYKKAMNGGMILNGATIFGMNSSGQLMGGGEAGAEAVVGVNSLYGMIQRAVASSLGSVTNNTMNNSTTINVYGAEGQDVNALAEIIEEKISANVRREGMVW